MNPYHLLWLGIAMLAAMVFGAVARRFKQPRVLGALMAGIMIAIVGGSTHTIHEIRHHEAPFITGLAEIAAMLLLFRAGLEGNLHSILHDAKQGWKVAVIGVVVPMVGGFGYMLLFGEDISWQVALFQGGVFAATSVGITAAVLKELGVLNADFSRTIISAAVIDDVLGLIVLTVCASLNEAQTSSSDLALKIAGALVFVVVIPIVGHYMAPRILKGLGRLDVESREAIVLAFMVLYGAAALIVGLAAIVGAYFAGVALDEELFERKEGEHVAKPIEHFIDALVTGLSPVFFAYAGTIVDPAVFLDLETICDGAIFSIIAVAGKLACGSVVPKDRLVIGIGMAPRGEVGIVFATIGIQAGILTQRMFGASMIMVLVTTFITPPLLSWAIKKNSGATPDFALP